MIYLGVGKQTLLRSGSYAGQAPDTVRAETEKGHAVARGRTTISYRYGQFPWRDAKDQQCADQQVKGDRWIALFHHGYPGLTGVQFFR